MTMKSDGTARRVLNVCGALSLLVPLVLGVWWCLAEPREHFRGETVESPDGLTYLSVEETPFDDCELVVDGSIWPEAVGVAAPIEPGVHTVGCAPLNTSALVEFEAPRGFVFHLDYWGP